MPGLEHGGVCWPPASGAMWPGAPGRGGTDPHSPAPKEKQVLDVSGHGPAAVGRLRPGLLCFQSRVYSSELLYNRSRCPGLSSGAPRPPETQRPRAPPAVPTPARRAPATSRSPVTAAANTLSLKCSSFGGTGRRATGLWKEGTCGAALPSLCAGTLGWAAGRDLGAAHGLGRWRCVQGTRGPALPGAPPRCRETG